MQLVEIYKSLCIHDKRNPNNPDNLYPFDKDKEEVIEPRKDCACDNCFYGRDKLALEILRLREKSNNLKK